MLLQDEYGGRFAQQLNRGTGRVQRPTYATDDEGGSSTMSAEALRELWDTSGGDHAGAARAGAGENALYAYDSDLDAEED